MLLVIFDIVSMIIFRIFISVITYRQEEYIEEFKKEAIQMEDYTVQL